MSESEQRSRSSKQQSKVEPDSELGHWLAWTTKYVERSDPFRRIRERTGGMLTLDYFGWDKDRIKESGFGERSEAYGDKEPKAGIKLTNRPPRADGWYENVLKVELPEESRPPL